MKKIAVITATRAEYGLLSPLIKELRKYENEDFKTDLIVTGTHLSDKFGMTVNEIKKDGVRIDFQILNPLDSNDELDISKNQAQTLISFTEHFANEKYSGIVILGDRYETLAIAIAAGNTRTPIFHLCGGDTTEGAIDEWMRHAITKISYIHFPTNEKSRDRIIQLGEDPGRVFNFGSTSIDNIIEQASMTKEEAFNSIGLNECNYAVCTYHPATIDNYDIDYLMEQILEAVKSFPKIEFIFTKSNADQGGSRINEILDESEKQIKNLNVFDSLGVKRYLSLVKHSEFVLGNSSSGIIEAPALKVPVVNVGDRQKGRTGIENVINCGTSSKEIINAINTALSDEYREQVKNIKHPYGDGNAAKRISEKIIDILNNTNIDLKKKFYDYT